MMGREMLTRRRVAFALGAGALAVTMIGLTAAQALALEVSWAGRFRIRMFQTTQPSTFGDPAASAVGGTAGITRADAVGTNITNDQPTSSYVQQRFRVFTTFKANDDLKFVWGLEMGYIQWGLNNPNEGGSAVDSSGDAISKVGRGSGGGFDTDGVNLETKHAYLELTVPYFTTWKARAGLQAYTTNPPGWILDNDLAGVRLWGPLPFIDRAEFDYFVLSSSPGLPDNKNLGRANSTNEQWFGLELDKKVTKDLGVGLSFYYKKDDTGRADADPEDRITSDKFWLVPRASLKLGNVDMQLMVLYGHEDNADVPTRVAAAGDNVINREGWGVDFSAKTQIGPWTPLFAVVWAQGDRDGNPCSSGAPGPCDGTNLDSLPMLDGRRRTLADPSTSRGNDILGFYYYSDILFANIGDDSTLLDDPNNFDLGLIFVHLEAKYAATKELAVMPFYNYARSHSKNNAGDLGAGSSEIGHEFGAVFTYRFWGNAALDVVPVYFLTGDFFKTAVVTDPDDIWKITTRLQYVF